MINRILLLGSVFVCSNALVTSAELKQYQNALKNNNAYITATGGHVNVMMPMRELYQGETTYLTEEALAVIDVFQWMISQSSGRIALQGLLNEDTENINFYKSALYAQVSHLSQYLLENTVDVSYAPVVVSAYEKNTNYGIWGIYPDDEVFLNLSLIID